MTRTFFCIALLLASSKVAARDVEVHVFDRSPPTQFQLIEPGRDADAIVSGELPAGPSLEDPLGQSETVASKPGTMPLRLAISVPAWMRGGRRTPVAVLLAGKVVIDTNNYMPWHDGNYPIVDAGEKTEHDLRQEQLPASKVVKAFTHIQAPRILTWGRPAGSPRRLALSASSNFPEAVAVVRRLYDQFGFDTVENSPLADSWRTRPGQPAWQESAQTRAQLVANLARARRPGQPPG